MDSQYPLSYQKTGVKHSVKISGLPGYAFSLGVWGAVRKHSEAKKRREAWCKELTNRFLAFSNQASPLSCCAPFRTTPETFGGVLLYMGISTSFRNRVSILPMLVSNRVAGSLQYWFLRSGSGPHSPTQFFWEYPPGPGLSYGSDVRSISCC